jgi:diguanylate cyclase (GGDEF)-like protein
VHANQDAAQGPTTTVHPSCDPFWKTIANTTEFVYNEGDHKVLREAAVEKSLDIILAISLQFAQEHDLEKLLHLITQKAIELSSAQRGCIALLEEDGHLAPTAGVGIQPAEGQHISNTIARGVLHSQQAQMWQDLSTDPTVSTAESILKQRLRSAMCAPLQVKGKLLGVLYVDATALGQYTLADLAVFQTLAAQAAMAIENARLFQAVITDSLTGLYSGGFFRRRLEEEVKLHQQQGRPLSLIMADLNNLKGINDTYGHLYGSRALVTMGEILRQNVRSGDLACRYGGDEFAIILPDTDRAGGDAMRQRIEAACREVSTDEMPGWMGACLGVATYPQDGDSGAALIAQADCRMYEEKQALYAALGRPQRR